jgi:3-oxoacyl-[acyl-carrier-protein] synthase-3
VRPGSLLLLPGFGGGLSYSAHVVRWGERTRPLQSSTVQLPPNERTALEIIRACLKRKTTPADPQAEPFAGL